jgi:hypothetical protein
MSVPIIALDAGHGLHTVGKETPDKIKEWSLNDAVCDIITEILSAYSCTILRLDNNEGVVDESLTNRVNKAINAGAKVLVSIHHNAFRGVWGTHTGVEIYTDNKPTAEDKELAALVYNNLVKNLDLKGRGVKKAAFTIINTNKITAILCEGGFMDSSIDYKIITSPSGQRAYAEAVAKSLIDFYKLEKKTTEPEVRPTRPSVIYQTYDNQSKRWLPNVTDLTDYAGIYGRTVGGVYANLSSGNITYKVHTKGGKWLPAVSNRTDYAGVKGKAIDGLMMTTDTLHKIHYAVHLKKANRWLPFVTGYDSSDANNGYAGILGQVIDGIKIYIE